MTRFTITTLAALSIGFAVPATQASAQYADAGVRSFLAADQDGDELLTLSEFRVFIQEMAAAGAPMSARVRNLGAYRIAFSRVDLNNDGVATPEELRAAERAN